MTRLPLHLLRSRSGATAIEYAFLVAFIAVAIVGALTALGVEVDSAFMKAKNSFPAG